MANYEEKTVLMDEATSKRAVSRIAYEIVERNRGTENLVIIGIQTKGVSLAKLIIKKIEEIEGIKLELGSLDITFYRDDLTRLSKHPVVAGNDIAFSIEDKKIILVDDVLYSGRTIRAAMEELFDMGPSGKNRTCGTCRQEETENFLSVLTTLEKMFRLRMMNILML